jgi:hypothetical protein
MRAAVLLALASGCIISEPAGKPQTWPPPLGVFVEAVTAGDLDGNGSTDVVVFASGDENQAGMYLLTGGKDLGNGSTRPVRSFTKFVPAALQNPSTALQLGGSVPSVYVATAEDKAGDDPGDKIELTRYSNILAEQDRVTTSVPTGKALLWLHPIAFPGNMLHIAASDGSSIDHVAGDFGDVKPIPAPASATDRRRGDTDVDPASRAAGTERRNVRVDHGAHGPGVGWPDVLRSRWRRP